MAYSQLRVLITLVLVTHCSQYVCSSKIANSSYVLETTMNDTISQDRNNESMNLSMLDADIRQNVTEGAAKARIKRQGSGAGKFTDAAKMSQTKVARLVGQMMKNLWAPSYKIDNQRVIDVKEHTTNPVLIYENDSVQSVASSRLKRQLIRDDEGNIMDKYTEVVKLPHKKMLPLIVKVISDIWSASEYGGKKPLENMIDIPAMYILRTVYNHFIQTNYSRTINDRICILNEKHSVSLGFKTYLEVPRTIGALATRRAPQPVSGLK